MEPCLNKGYTVYMDNYYSSPRLFKDLLVAGTTATGTLPKISLCTSSRSLEICQEELSFAYNGNLTVVKWSDNRDVHAISTVYSNQMTRVKCQVDGESVEIPYPEIIVYDYNAFMGGVDLWEELT